MIKSFNKQLVDGLSPPDIVDTAFNLAGNVQSIKIECRAVITENVDIQKGGQLTIKGILLLPDDFVLLTNQINPAENGFYIVMPDTWIRASESNLVN